MKLSSGVKQPHLEAAIQKRIEEEANAEY